MTLQTILARARKEGWAVPHFNASDFEQFRGICEAAAKLRAPIMIGTSEGERNFIGLRAAVALVGALRKEFGIPLFLNADHTKSVKAAKKAIDAGYDSIHIDLSRQPWKKNLEGTRAVVQYAKKSGRTINIEGELGYLATESSQIYKKKILVDPETFTKPEEAKRFVAQTKVDRFAPAVGNLHGIAANRPRLNFNLVKTLRATLPKNVALVLHGGSGNTPEAFKKAIKSGVSNIHISTELRMAYASGLRTAQRTIKNELAPYKLAAPVVEAVRKKAEYFIKLFGANNKL